MIVVLDESRDEFVQANLENLFCGRILQPCQDAVSVPLRRALTAVGFADAIQEMHYILVTGNERTRHFRFEDQEIRHEPGPYVLAVNPMIGRVRRDRTQDRGPLEIIQRTAHPLRLRKKNVIFHVENARRIIRPLDIKTEPREPIGVIA